MFLPMIIFKTYAKHSRSGDDADVNKMSITVCLAITTFARSP
jgi:hypothetical protein